MLQVVNHHTISLNWPEQKIESNSFKVNVYICFLGYVFKFD